MITGRNEPFQKLIRAALASLNDHWIVKSILILIPTISAFAISFPPIQVYLMTMNNKGEVILSTKGFVVLVICICCLIVETLSNIISSHDNSDRQSYVAEIQIRRNASINESIYEDEKNRVLKHGYRQIAYDNNNLIDYIIHYVNPKERTNQILTQISKCIANESEVDANEIAFSAVVSLDNGDWSWFCLPDYGGRGHLNELLRRNSALKQVINNCTYFYSNDKKKATEVKQYVPDRRDKTNNNVGSIICWEVATQLEHEKTNETHSIRMIISISTYGKKLIETHQKNEKIDWVYTEVIEKMILNQFKGELTEVLIWYGLQKLKN